MELEKQVVSLDLSRQLKELGVPQESVFSWVTTELNHQEFALVTSEYLDTLDRQHMTIDEDGGVEGYTWKVRECYAAFTVAELGELTKGITESSYSPTWGKWACGMRETADHCPIYYEDTEADARARMLVYLKTEGVRS